jgi:hypothetical protein
MAIIAASLMLPLTRAAAEVPRDCSRERWIPQGEAREALSRRSVEIVDRGLQGDTAALAALVSPSAAFTVWEGDASAGREAGPVGAVEFAKRLDPTDFQAAVVSPGPIASDICGSQQVTMLFTRADGKRTYVADFKYLKGRLIEAVAHLASLSRGKVGGR